MPGERVRFPKGCNFEKSENGGPHEFQSVRSKCLICRGATLKTLKMLVPLRISKFSEFRVLRLAGRQL